MLIKSVVNENENKYYYKIFLEKFHIKINECLYIINAIL